MIGGILEIAEAPGFLANLAETYQAADAERQAWSSFVAQWWHRLGADQVGVADLYPVAVMSGVPLSEGGERAQRTSLGQTLTQMRDRVYVVDGQRVQLRRAGTVKRAQQWQLESLRDDGKRFPNAASLPDSR